MGVNQPGANIVGSGVGEGPGPDIMAAATLDGDKVMSSDGEHVGKISDIARARDLTKIRSNCYHKPESYEATDLYALME